MHHTLISPLFVPKNLKGDKWYLNLNNLNNTHYQSYNTMKKRYKGIMQEQILKLPKMGKVSVTFRIYPANKRLFDVGNVSTVHEKMCLDALVELGVLEEDNYLFVPETHTYFAEIDRTNPRVEIEIEEIANA